MCWRFVCLGVGVLAFHLFLIMGWEFVQAGEEPGLYALSNDAEAAHQLLTLWVG